MSDGPHLTHPGGDIPAGFEQTAGGLVVPTGSQAVEREQWRREDGQVFRRAYAVAELHNILLMVGCNDDRCAENPVIERILLTGGGFALRCRHKERIVGQGAMGRGR